MLINREHAGSNKKLVSLTLHFLAKLYADNVTCLVKDHINQTVSGMGLR